MYRATIVAEMMNDLKKQLEKDIQNSAEGDKKWPQSNRWKNEHLNALVMGTKAKTYQKLLDGPTEKS